MGLDQYWFADKRTKADKTEYLITGEEYHLEEIGYHRKFWDLQKFIDTENCELLQIEEEMVADLRKWCDETLKELDKLNVQDEYEMSQYHHLSSLLDRIEDYLGFGYLVYYQADW